MKIFISYAKQDHKVAKQLYDDLKNAGLLPWMDTEDLLPGQTSEIETDKAIRASDYFLILLSANSVTKAGLVHAEIRKALKRFQEFTPGETFIIPVRLDDCEPAYEELQALCKADIFPSYEQGLKKILSAILSEKKEQPEKPKAHLSGHAASPERKSVESQKHKWVQWVFSGIGVFIIGLIVTWFSPSQTPTKNGGVHIGGDVKPGGDVNITGQGNITVTKHYGVTEESYQKYVKELGVTEAALSNFFKILEQEKVPIQDLDKTLREIAGRYKELREKLEKFQSDDPAIKELKRKAKEALDAGSFDQAEKFLQEAKIRDIDAAKQLKETANKRMLSAAETMAEIGNLKNAQLKYNEAAAYYKEAAEIVPEGSELILVGYLNAWGFASYHSGDYAGAKVPLERSLAIREKVLCADHPDVATSLNNLAELYRTQCKYELAEPLYKRSLAITKKAFGEQNPDVATILSNLAVLYYAQGKYEQAELLYKHSLLIREKVLREHPDVAESLNNLAALYDKQGKYDKAEPLYRRSLAIWEKAFGEEHPDVAKSLNNIAVLYYNQGKYDEAKPLYDRAYKIFLIKFGEQHPFTKEVRKHIELLNAACRVLSSSCLNAPK